jgi:hypothetical protein
MITRKNLIVILLIGLMVVPLSGCDQTENPGVALAQATGVPPTNTPLPPTQTTIPPTATPIPQTDTPVPPTETPIPQTETPTATLVPPTATSTPEPTEPLPEFLVTNYEDMIGKWVSTSLRKDYMVFKASGVSQGFEKNGALIGSSMVHFENDLFLTESKECQIVDAATGTVVVERCTGIYKVYLSKDGDTPVCLRFEVIEDPDGMRSAFITPYLWCWAKE